MSMRLVCDHCENVIHDSNFVEVTKAEMTQNATDPVAGIQRAGTAMTNHYHSVCCAERERAGDDLTVTSTPAEPVEEPLPSDHPLAMTQYEQELAQAEQERLTGDPTLVHESPETVGVEEPVVTSSESDTISPLPSPPTSDADAPIETVPEVAPATEPDATSEPDYSSGAS